MTALDALTFRCARVAESVDARDSKSLGLWPYEFESRPGYCECGNPWRANALRCYNKLRQREV